VENLQQFFTDAKADKLERFIDSKRDSGINYKNVVKLDSATFNNTISENDFVFVEFYSPNCGHCVRFAPEYEKVAKHFKNAESKVVIAAVDASDE
jgi:thiol-disulfide isomerase/thioredoxin